MFLNDVSLRLCRLQRCCYPSCFLPCSRFMRSRFPAHESIALNGAVWRSKASNLIPGAIVPNHRSEEHTSELQSRFDLICRLLLENKNNSNTISRPSKE